MIIISPQVCTSDHFGRFFVAAMVKLLQFVISEPDKVRHRSRADIQQDIQIFSKSVSTSCDIKFVLSVMTSALHHD